jgi:hypothetical protein
MRKFVILVVLISATVGLVGTAAADHVPPGADDIGPTNSDFVGGNVICGNDPNNFLQGPPISAYNGEEGLEVCIDGSGSNPGLRVFLRSNEEGPIYLPETIHGDIDKDTPLLGGSGHFLDIDFPF